MPSPRNKPLPRRTFLRAAGATLALPLLDAMLTAAPTPTTRLGFIYIPHGAVMDQWTPASTAPDFALSPILQPLAAPRARLPILTNPPPPQTPAPRRHRP